MKYLFIDFDGVLHSHNDPKGLFSKSNFLYESLKDHLDNFKIVISSSWRENYEFDILVEAFHPKMHHLIIGTTPTLENNMLDGMRYLEIIQYCENNQISNHQWIALDDMENLFPQPCENLILVNPSTGINSNTIQQILNFLDQSNKPKIKL